MAAVQLLLLQVCTGMMSLALALRPVDRIVGRWNAPPTKVPSDSVVDGPLLGNGLFGAVLGSDVAVARCANERPGCSGYKPSRGEVRYYLGANDMYAAPTNGFSSCGYPDLDDSNKPGMKQVGGLTIVAPALGSGSLAAPVSFAAEQRPANGTVTTMLRGTHGTELTIRSWAHATDPYLMVELAYRSADPRMQVLKLSAETWSVLGCGLGPDPLVEDSFLPVKTGLGGTENDTLWVQRANGFDYQQQDGVYNLTRYTVAARMLQAAGKRGFQHAMARQQCAPSTVPQHYGATYLPCSVGNFTMRAGTSSLLVVSVLSDRSVGWVEDMVETSLTKLEMIDEAAYTRLRTQHNQWWDKYWAASSVSWPSSPLVEHMYYQNLYILALSAAEGSTAAPGLYGPFITMDQMLWAGDLTLNYNAEAVFYGALSSNRPWLLDGYLATIADITSAASDLAKRQFPHCEPGALYFPGHILPHGVLTSDDMDMGQKQLGLFATFHAIQYWRFTRSVEFARSERGYQLLRGVGLFWECWLVRNATDTEIANGSPYEFNDLNDCDNELCAPSGKRVSGITLVLSLLPALFESIVDMSVVLGVDSDRRAAWKDIATHIHPYPTSVLPNSTTEVYIDYDHCDRLQGGAQACLWSAHMPVFPLGTVGLNSSAEAISLAKNSVEAWGHFLNWRTLDSARQFAAAARIGYNASNTLSALESILSPIDDGYVMYPSGYISDGDCVGLENAGFVAAVNEWCLQSHEGALRILQTTPPGHAIQFTDLRAEGGFLVSSAITAAGEIANFSVTLPASSILGADTAQTVVLPKRCTFFVPKQWESADAIVVREGVTGTAVEVREDRPRVVSFAVRANVTYIASLNTLFI